MSNLTRDLDDALDRLGVDQPWHEHHDGRDRPVIAVSVGDEPVALIALPESIQPAALVPPKYAAQLGAELLRLAEVLTVADDRGFDRGVEAGRKLR
jgi:hypothetical protein